MTINEAIKECKEYLEPQPIRGTNSAYSSRDIALYTILLELLEKEKLREEKETCNDILTLINGVRKDLEIVRQNLNEMQNMMYRCSTDKEFEDWLKKHDPEFGTNYVMIFGE